MSAEDRTEEDLVKELMSLLGNTAVFTDTVQHGVSSAQQMPAWGRIPQLPTATGFRKHDFIPASQTLTKEATVSRFTREEPKAWEAPSHLVKVTASEWKSQHWLPGLSDHIWETELYLGAQQSVF